ncbi:hypothetical protein D3C81_2078570 [compost metagenome]
MTGDRTISPKVKMTVTANRYQMLVCKPTKKVPKPDRSEDRMNTFRSLHLANQRVTGRMNKTNKRPLKPTSHPKISVPDNVREAPFQANRVWAGT